MVAGLSSIYDRLGDESEFVSRDGWSCDCAVIVEHELSEYGDAIQVSAGSILLRVRKSELSRRPLREEFFLMSDSGCKYVVEQTLESDDFEHKVIAK
jgi:hypothetical protein